MQRTSKWKWKLHKYSIFVATYLSNQERWAIHVDEEWDALVCVLWHLCYLERRVILHVAHSSSRHIPDCTCPTHMHHLSRTANEQFVACLVRCLCAACACGGVCWSGCRSEGEYIWWVLLQRLRHALQRIECREHETRETSVKSHETRKTSVK